MKRTNLVDQRSLNELSEHYFRSLLCERALCAHRQTSKANNNKSEKCKNCKKLASVFDDKEEK